MFLSSYLMELQFMQTLKALSYFLLHSLHNVLYIPGFNFNLIFVSQLAIKFDCSIRFTDQICEIQDNHTMRMIGFAKMHHGLYVLENPKGPGKHFAPDLISINFVSVNKVND